MTCLTTLGWIPAVSRKSPSGKLCAFQEPFPFCCFLGILVGEEDDATSAHLVLCVICYLSLSYGSHRSVDSVHRLIDFSFAHSYLILHTLPWSTSCSLFPPLFLPSLAAWPSLICCSPSLDIVHVLSLCVPLLIPSCPPVYSIACLSVCLSTYVSVLSPSPSPAIYLVSSRLCLLLLHTLPPSVSNPPSCALVVNCCLIDLSALNRTMLPYP